MKEFSLYKVRMQDRKLVIISKDQSGKDSIILAINKDSVVSLEISSEGLDMFCKYDNEISKKHILLTNNESQSSELLSLIHNTRVEYAKLMKLKLRILDEDGAIKEIPLKSIQTLNITIVEENDKEFHNVVINSSTEGETSYAYVDDESARDFYDDIDKLVTDWNDKFNDFSLFEGIMKQSDLYINT